MSESLMSLMKKERPWAIRSVYSWWKSEWANRSCFLCELLIHSFAHKKWAIRSKSFQKIVFLRPFSKSFSLKKKPEQFAHSFFFKELCERIAQVTNEKEQPEQIAQVAHQKWAKEQTPLFWANRTFAHFFAKKSYSIRSENRWANFQPWPRVLVTFEMNWLELNVCIYIVRVENV